MSTTTAASPQPQTSAPVHAGVDVPRTESLGTYIAPETGQQREVLRVQRPGGGALVIDYRFGTLSDGRLVAHLAPDEHAENAQIVCDLYLADDRRGRCRPVTSEDFTDTRPAASPAAPDTGEPVALAKLRDDAGYVYCIRELASEDGAPELRWTRSREADSEDVLDVVTLREVVGRLEAYDPPRALTRRALATCRERVSTHRLKSEVRRLAESSIVLNGGLRAAVQRELRRGQLSLSEIALRCGRAKRDAAGNVSGETSWLARRIGMMPEAGAQHPRPWIRSDVLALIARDGLGLCPREVEL